MCSWPSVLRMRVVRISIDSTVPDRDEIADLEVILEQDEKARHHVVDQRLGSESEHESGESCSCQKWHRVKI